ncbi:MAG: TolC family protein [Gallionella sp.]|nr:TolC family protein [Gallionella sp.]
MNQIEQNPSHIGRTYSRPPPRLLVRRGIPYLTCAALLLPSASKAGGLEQLISTALLGHPSIQAQQALEQGSKANVDSATWQYYPTPSIVVENATASTSDNAYQGNSTVSTLRLQQPLWTGGRLTAGVKKAEANVLVSQAALEEVRQQLALRVVQIYGDWLSAHLKTLAFEHGLASHDRLRDQVKRRIGQGASSDSDLILAVTRLQSVAADLSVARAQRDTALTRLEQLQGRRIDGDALSAAIASPKPVIAEPQKLLDMALAINPGLHKAQGQAMVHETVIAERRADLSPEVYLRAERQYGNHTYPNTNPETRLFVGLSSRFGAGLSSLSNIENARSQHQAAMAEIDVQRRAITEQILADHVLAVSSENRLEALNASLEAAGQVSESYDRQFLAGRKTWLDVMNAARELTQTQAQLADIKSAQIVATWRLAINTQGLAAVVGDEK